MYFEWNKKKNELNIIKHGIGFETASLVFHDPFILTLYDDRYEEERWISIGKVYTIVVYVAYLIKEENYEQEETVRIISARSATPSEKRRYYTHKKNEKRN